MGSSQQSGVILVALLVASFSGLQAAEPVAEAPASTSVEVAADSAAYRRHFDALLASAFDESPPDARAAERNYRALLALRPGEARIEFAYGLALMKLHQHSEGISHMQRAAKSDPPYLPARQMLIREALRQQEYAAALDQLVQLAEGISTPQRRGAPASQPIARWAGIVIDFLAGPAELKTLDDEILEADAAIRRALPANLQQLYDAGQQQTEAVVAALDAQAQAARLQAAETLREEQSATQARIDASRSRQQELQSAQKEHQLRSVDTSASLEEQLEQVSDRFDSLNRTATGLLQSIQMAQRTIQQLQAEAEAAAENGRRNNRFLEVQLMTRSREVDLLMGEYSNTLQSREQTARQGRALVTRWKATISRARRTDSTAQARLQKFEKLNQQLARSLEESRQSDPESRQTRRIARRRRSLSTYDPFDLDRERQRLAAELEPADQ